VNAFQRFLGRERSLVGMLACAREKEKNGNDNGKNRETARPNKLGLVHYCVRLSHVGVKVV